MLPYVLFRACTESRYDTGGIGRIVRHPGICRQGYILIVLRIDDCCERICKTHLCSDSVILGVRIILSYQILEHVFPGRIHSCQGVPPCTLFLVPFHGILLGREPAVEVPDEVAVVEASCSLAAHRFIPPCPVVCGKDECHGSPVGTVVDTVDTAVRHWLLNRSRMFKGVLCISDFYVIVLFESG